MLLLCVTAGRPCIEACCYGEHPCLVTSLFDCQACLPTCARHAPPWSGSAPDLPGAGQAVPAGGPAAALLPRLIPAALPGHTRGLQVCERGVLGGACVGTGVQGSL